MLNKFLHSTLFRFLTVGAVVEILYLGIYWVFLSLGFNPAQSIFLAGSICITLNGYLQIRWSFKLQFKANHLIKFYSIQGICLAVNIGIGSLLATGKVNDMSIGIITLFSWGGLSYLMSRAVYKFDKKV